jgi:thiol peroxidase
MTLEDEPLDIGYASEKVGVLDTAGKKRIIGGQNGKTQVVITAPFLDDSLANEIDLISKGLPGGTPEDVTLSLVVASSEHSDPGIEGVDYYVDSEGEFGDWYGVRLVGGPCDGELTKAVFVISKDGALFYDEFVATLHDTFTLERLNRKVSAAIECYTGKGCH